VLLSASLVTGARSTGKFSEGEPMRVIESKPNTVHLTIYEP